MYYVEIVTNISRVKRSYTMWMLSEYLKIKVFFTSGHFESETLSWSQRQSRSSRLIVPRRTSGLIVHKLKTFEGKAKLTEISVNDMI